LSNFNISYEELVNILKFTNGFIAGCFTLSAFVNGSIKETIHSKSELLSSELSGLNETINSNILPKDQDIDIFIRIPYIYKNTEK